jgi:hypothetical protein
MWFLAANFDTLDGVRVVAFSLDNCLIDTISF